MSKISSISEAYKPIPSFAIPPIIIYIPGVWDLLHLGHVTILQRAKALGDRLIVGVPCDDTVYRDKGELPVITLIDRCRMLDALKCVDVAIPYFSLNFIPHLELVKPDILIVGESWGKDTRHIQAEQWVRDNNRRLIVLPYTEGVSSTELKNKIRGMK
jgi:glycerol-3-phosphate cytidylyltransferase